MKFDMEQFQERYDSRHTLVARVYGPQTRAIGKDVPPLIYYTVVSSVYDSDGRELMGSVASSNEEHGSSETAKTAGIAAARFWAQTSL